MAETRKARDRRVRDGWFDRFCPADRPGLDVGCAADPVHPTFRQWDMALGHGDAAHLAGIPADAFPSVYASHVLEHMPDPEAALREWYRVTAPGGHLCVAVPDWRTYEGGKPELPSWWNADHKSFWVPGEPVGLPPAVRGLHPTVGRALPDAAVVWARDPDADCVPATETSHAGGEYSIEIVVRKPAGALAPADVLILSAATEAFDPDGVAEANHARFARAAGHGHRFRRAGFHPERPPAWSKVLFLLDALADARWVFWIDADAVFRKPADLRPLTDPAYEMVVGRDPGGINTGVFFLRAGPWARQFLARVWALGCDWRWGHHGWWEQAAIGHLIATDPDVARRVKLVDYRLFNGRPHLEDDPDGLVAHFAGLPHAEKLARVREWGCRPWKDGRGV